MNPTEFELFVKRWCEEQSGSLDEFDAQHREILSGSDSEYEIDVSIRFKIFDGAQIHLLVECKNHKNPIKREIVQILNDRLRATGAHKGFIFTTARFQSGAIEYADKNGIALVQVTDGSFAYIQATNNQPQRLPKDFPEYVGWHIGLSHEGRVTMKRLSPQNSNYLKGLLTADKEGSNHTELKITTFKLE